VTTRPRNRKSAKTAGTRFERQVADYLAQHVDERIDRRAKTGAKDRGDITGLYHMGGRLVVEIKNTTRLNLAGWANETNLERGNDDALAGIVVHKRHGNNNPADQWVHMTLGELVALLTGTRTHLEET
jgi:hypothetical protein